MRRPLLARALVVPALILLLGAASSCGVEREPLRIGAKSFAEQHLLAHMLAQLLAASGREARVVACGDTYACERQLQRGGIDLMVEYSGTGLAMLGVEPEQPERSLAQARRLYASLGLSWLGPLGFDNSFCLVVTAERAAALGLAAIEDLTKIEGVRMVVPDGYVWRPVDGLPALLLRHGLRLDGKPRVIVDPLRRFQALLDGQADVAVGYTTDGAIGRLGLVVLEDRLRFFPPYEAAILTRAELLEREVDAAAVLGRLEGRLDTATMQDLNFAVAVAGRSPREVARRHLRALGWLVADEHGVEAEASVGVLVHAHDDLHQLTTAALQATRAAFPEQPARLVRSTQPVLQLRRGGGLALLGAERFFDAAGRGAPRRVRGIEAVAVIGHRFVHLVRRAAEALPADPLAGRVGVGPAHSGAALIGEALLASSAAEPAARAPVEVLLAQVRAGSLDAALVVLPAGDRRLASALAAGELTLAGLDGWLSPPRAVRLPFLRPARLPARSYRSQPEPLETLGAQVLLAGAANGRLVVSSAGSPAAALPASGTPLTAEEAAALRDAAGEAPDPVLPSRWALGAPIAADRAGGGLGAAALETVLNLFVVLFLVALVRLVLQRGAARG